MTTRSVTTGETSTGITLNNGDFLYVSPGGTAISITVSSGGTADVFAGGTASFTTVSSGGTEYVSGGTADSTTLTDADAIQIVYAGGTASFTTVSSGGTDNVSGGTASFTTLSRGGTENVYANGTTISAMARGGAVENVYSGGTADFTAVSRGGTANVYSGGTAAFAVVSSGGTENVYSSGAASASVVRSGGTQFVHSAGSARGIEVRRGGAEFVYSAGTAINTTVSGGGLLVVLPGGTLPGLNGLFNAKIISTGVVLYQPQSGTTALGASATDILVGSGAIEYLLPGGTTSFTTVSSGGTENVFASGAAVSTTVNSGGTEFVHSGADPISTTVNVGGSIDVSDLSYASGGSASVNTSDLLTVSVGGHLYVQQLAGGYADAHFQLAPDARSGTLVTAEAGAPCFRSFTRILTDRGEVPVEALRVDDLVRTVLGETMAPIIWIGRREVHCARHPQPRKVWPVRIAAGAFGPGQPGADLFLSPDHAVYLNEVLIPIRHLINASTITQVPVDHVTYYHLELSRHDVLFAEGLPAESFLDMRDGSNYANRPGPSRLYPDFSARMWEAFGCARLIVTGPELTAARALVARHAVRQEAA